MIGIDCIDSWISCNRVILNTNKAFREPDSRRANGKDGSRISADVIQDTFENDHSDACFCSLQYISVWTLQYITCAIYETTETDISERYDSVILLLPLLYNILFFSVLAPFFFFAVVENVSESSACFWI